MEEKFRKFTELYDGYDENEQLCVADACDGQTDGRTDRWHLALVLSVIAIRALTCSDFFLSLERFSQVVCKTFSPPQTHCAGFYVSHSR